MAISPVVIARAYLPLRSRPESRLRTRRRLCEQTPQRDERGQRRQWRRSRSHRGACRGVQHPERDLLDAAGRHRRETASSTGATSTIYDIVDVNRPAKPGMPAVGNDRIMARSRVELSPMGLVV